MARLARSRYLRQLPTLAGINMQHELLWHRAELVKTLETESGRTEPCALTGPDYGRIWDHHLIAAVMKIAGDGIGDTRWKVSGLLDWSTMTHSPQVEVTKDTTLYASGRDVFLFLVDDTHPIEAGKLPNGDPISTSAASIAGTARSARRRLAWQASTCVRSA